MKCDLHVHTSYSYDCSASPKEMVEAAIKKGINCLAITDHDQIKGALAAMAYAREKSILIIPGIEIKTKNGDILALNIKKIISNRLSAKEVVKKIKEVGGLAIIPHPFGWCCSFKEGLENLSFKEDLEKLIGKIDGLEVLNASLFGRGNKKALAFAQKYNLPFTAGSDAHSPGFIGKAYLEIPGENLSIEEIINGIKNKNGKISEEKIGLFEKIIDHLKRNMAKVC